MTGSSDELERKVREAYSAAAREPHGRHPFPVGGAFAVSLGYPEELLAALPAVAVEAFTGVSNLSVRAALAGGMRVLDLGCGAGLDTLIAARRVGRDGCVVGVDFSEPMLARARRAASEARCEWVAFCRATAGRLPLADGAVDVALVNGLFNLNPERAAIFRELARVVRRGGAVYAAELILTAPLPAEQRDEASWFA